MRLGMSAIMACVEAHKSYGFRLKAAATRWQTCALMARTGDKLLSDREKGGRGGIQRGGGQEGEGCVVVRGGRDRTAGCGTSSREADGRSVEEKKCERRHIKASVLG